MMNRMRGATSYCKHAVALADVLYMKNISCHSNIYDVFKPSDNYCKTTQNEDVITVLETITGFL